MECSDRNLTVSLSVYGFPLTSATSVDEQGCIQEASIKKPMYLVLMKGNKRFRRCLKVLLSIQLKASQILDRCKKLRREIGSSICVYNNKGTCGLGLIQSDKNTVPCFKGALKWMLKVHLGHSVG